MSSGVNLILSLAGSFCAAASLAAGEALRKDDEPFRRRVTSRMLLSLTFLGSAVVGSAVECFRAPQANPSGPWLSLLLLAAGAGATLWAYMSGPRRRGDESFGERITSRGKVALGLLAAAQLVDLPSGRLPGTIQQVQASASGAVSTLALLGLVLVSLGTAGVTATLRSGSPLLSGTGPLLRRLSPLARGSLTLLGLALAVVGLAGFISSAPGIFVSLVLLALGTTTGLAAFFFASKPGPWGISSRGWVSLTFLALAGAVLGAQEARLLGPVVSKAASKTATAPRQPVGQVVDPLSPWGGRKYQSIPADPASPPDRTSERVRSPSSVDLSEWSHEKSP